MVPTEINPADELRFPTNKEIVKIMNDTDTEMHGWTDVSNYKLASRFFPIETLNSSRMRMYQVRNPSRTGMTYFHAIGTEPRTFTNTENREVLSTEWAGGHFKEGVTWNERELTEKGELLPAIRNDQINDEVAEALVTLSERRKRRMEWLAAQVLVKGVVSVAATDADNPEGVAYDMDMQVDTPVINVPTKFDALTGGVSDVDIVKWFYDLKDAAERDTATWGAYVPSEILVTKNFVRVLRGNTKFLDTYYKFLRAETVAQRERMPAYLMTDDMLVSAFTQMTGIKVTVVDHGYRDPNNNLVKFIPDNTMVILYGVSGPLGRMTLTAHAHGNGKKLTRGTGPYTIVVDKRLEANPSYSIFHGWHGAPRLDEYDNKTLKNHRFKSAVYSSFNGTLYAPA